MKNSGYRGDGEEGPIPAAMLKQLADDEVLCRLRQRRRRARDGIDGNGNGDGEMIRTVRLKDRDGGDLAKGEF